jgi:cell fate regulator YaaT (PSP1 superfamily)
VPIVPLPQFEADLAELEADRKTYAKLSVPETLVVRFGYLKFVGEFPNRAGAKPGCGSKIVVRTGRGTEIGEMLTSTCPNSGCSKSVSRKEMLDYIENSGGKDYPYFTEGEALRIATAEDMDRQARMEQARHGMRIEAKTRAERLGLPLKVVDVEPMLGNERVTVYYLSEERIDFRQIVQELSNVYGTYVEMRPVGARDEARITADYERCGQYCCCKNFLKVLKPVSMKSAKVQKATLDPLKISGRCGRLMCCLRYEDQTYDDLKKRLPRKKSRVGTPEGDGIVIDTQILTQLALVRLDTGKDVAIPVENLGEPVSMTPPELPVAPIPGARGGRSFGRPGPGNAPRPGGPGRDTRERPPEPRTSEPAGGRAQPPAPRDARADAGAADRRAGGNELDEIMASFGAEPGADTGAEGPPRKKRKRRRKKRPAGEGGPVAPDGTGDASADGDGGPGEDDSDGPDSGPDTGADTASDSGPDDSDSGAPNADGGGKKRRRRRRRRRGGGGPGGDAGGPAGGEPGAGGPD